MVLLCGLCGHFILHAISWSSRFYPHTSAMTKVFSSSFCHCCFPNRLCQDNILIIIITLLGENECADRRDYLVSKET